MSMNEPDPGESWSPPEDESAGLNTSAPGTQPTSEPEQNDILGNIAEAGKQTPMEGIRQFPGNVKRIASYLMGAGATPPQEAEKLIDQLKQQGMTDDDANLLAIHEAAAAGGPAAAWGMIQYNRMAFNAKQSFARVALNGVDGKAGDIAAAAEAATKAGSHIPDGSSVSFHADRWGVTATVSLPGTSQRQTFDMTPQQFNQYLDLSKTSQWDRLMEEGGVPVALTKVGAKPLRGAAQDDTSSDANASAGIPEDEQPGTVERPEYQQPIYRGKLSDEQAAEKRSYAMFPRAHLDAAENAKREGWLASQEEKAATRENAVDVAAEKGKWADKRAATSGGFHVQSAEVTADGRKATAAARVSYLRDDLNRKIQSMSQGHQDAAMRERGRLARAELLTNPGIDEAGLAKIYARHGIQLPQGATATSGSSQQPQSQQPQQGKKFYNGKWYTKDEYMRDVLGQGQ